MPATLHDVRLAGQSRLKSTSRKQVEAFTTEAQRTQRRCTMMLLLEGMLRRHSEHREIAPCCWKACCEGTGRTVNACHAAIEPGGTKKPPKAAFPSVSRFVNEMYLLIRGTRSVPHVITIGRLLGRWESGDCSGQLPPGTERVQACEECDFHLRTLAPSNPCTGHFFEVARSRSNSHSEIAGCPAHAAGPPAPLPAKAKGRTAIYRPTTILSIQVLPWLSERRQR